MAIFGLYQSDEKPIQDLNIEHDDVWVDYSHAFRLILNEAYVDGSKMRIADIRKDPQLAPALSDEGTIAVPRYPN